MFILALLKYHISRTASSKTLPQNHLNWHPKEGSIVWKWGGEDWVKIFNWWQVVVWHGDEVMYFMLSHWRFWPVYFLTWRVLLGVPNSLEPRRAASRGWVLAPKGISGGAISHSRPFQTCFRCQLSGSSATCIHGRWGAVSRYNCCGPTGSGSRWPLVSLFAFAIFGVLGAVRLWTTPHKFKHVPIEDIVVGEALLVKQILKKLT